MEKNEEKELVKLLSKLDPGFLPYEVFKSVARLVVTPIIEFVPLRVRDGRVEVLLIRRSKHDDIWPGELHTPGTVVRSTDNYGEMHGAYKRIIVEELKGLEISNPHYVGSLFHEGKRGAEQAQIFWVEVKEDGDKFKFYNADRLPADMMQQQKKFVAQAVKSYKEFKGL